MRRRHQRAVEACDRALSGDDRAARAFATGFRARRQHGESHAAEATDTQHHRVRIECGADIELRPHRAELQRIVIHGRLDPDLLDSQMTETAEQTRRDRPSRGLDDLGAGGGAEAMARSAAILPSLMSRSVCSRVPAELMVWIVASRINTGRARALSLRRPRAG